MELWQVRYFLAVANGLSFRAAAGRMNVSQPSLSRAVAKLEEELGVALFERGGRRIALTEAGQGFQQEALSLLAQAERAIGVARGRPTPDVVVSVAFEGSSVYDVVPRAIGRLLDLKPNISVRIVDLTTPDQVQAIREGRIDIGFLVTPVSAPGLVVTEIWRDELMVALPLKHRLAKRGGIQISELASEPFITGSRHDRCGLQLFVLALCRSAGFLPKVALDVNDMALVLGFVSAGVGVAVLPRYAVRTSLGLVAVPLIPKTSTSLAIAHRSGDTSIAVETLANAAVAMGRI